MANDADKLPVVLVRHHRYRIDIGELKILEHFIECFMLLKYWNVLP